MKRGFTLVELSIVLVIVGLLIGGILAAQSMIETAKVNNFVRQIQQYDIAVSNFQTKYNSLPGDSSALGCGNAGNNSSNVCNDGNIQEYNGSLYGLFDFSAEIANFWPQLQQGGFVNNAKTYSATLPTAGINTYSSNPNLPAIKASIEGAIAAGYCNMSGYNNCWEMGNWKSDSGGLARSSTFTPEFALAVDKKMDDGLSQSGAVRDWAAQGGITYSSSVFDLCIASTINGGPTNNYQVKNSGNVCIMSIGMLNQVGQIQ